MRVHVERARGLSRRGFVRTAALAAAGATESLAWPAGSAARGGDDDAQQRDVVPPKPIASGLQIPGGPFIHLHAPGDPSVTLPFSGTTLMGFDVEPTTITDFRGLSAVAFHAGSAKGADGATFNLETDMRAFKGAYVDADGERRRGAFAFI